jgi:hypothetical protein
MNVMRKLISTPGQLILISLLLAGFSNAADRGKNIVPHPNDPIPKAEVKKFTGDWKDAELSRDIRILWRRANPPARRLSGGGAALCYPRSVEGGCLEV